MIEIVYVFVAKPTHSTQQSFQPSIRDDTPILPGLSPVYGLDIHARFDGGQMSSNGGVLLREAGRSFGFGFGEMLGDCVADHRDPTKVIHSFASMIDARVVGIACGHEDCDDHDVMRHEPMIKMYCGKTPEAEVGLASQPTLSRLENTVSWMALARMGVKMIVTFCDSFLRPPDQIFLNIDDTTDLTHGSQQLSLFNTHAGGYCFQPILIFEAAPHKPVASVLRAGKRPFGRRGCQRVAPCRPSDQGALATRRDHDPGRCALRDARGHGCA